jgi:transposase
LLGDKGTTAMPCTRKKALFKPNRTEKYNKLSARPSTWRNRIERCFNRLKKSRRVAARYDKLIESFAAFVILATIRIWIRFVYTT